MPLQTAELKDEPSSPLEGIYNVIAELEARLEKLEIRRVQDSKQIENLIANFAIAKSGMPSLPWL